MLNVIVTLKDLEDWDLDTTWTHVCGERERERERERELHLLKTLAAKECSQALPG